MRRALLVAALLLGSAGCSDDGPTTALPSPPSSPPPSAAAPTPSVPAATPTADGGSTRTVSASESVFVLSPSGGIVCELSGRGASCEVRGRTFTPPPKPADCDLDWGDQVFVSPGAPAAFGCVGDTAFGAEPVSTLAYGDRLTNGVVTCTSARTGLSCTTVDGRHGFTLSRASYRLS